MLRNLLHLYAPQLTVAGAIQLAGAAESLELLRRALDACAFFPDQVQRLASQT